MKYFDYIRKDLRIRASWVDSFRSYNYILEELQKRKFLFIKYDSWMPIASTESHALPTIPTVDYPTIKVSLIKYYDYYVGSKNDIVNRKNNPFTYKK